MSIKRFAITWTMANFTLGLLLGLMLAHPA